MWLTPLGVGPLAPQCRGLGRLRAQLLHRDLALLVLLPLESLLQQAGTAHLLRFLQGQAQLHRLPALGLRLRVRVRVRGLSQRRLLRSGRYPAQRRRQQHEGLSSVHRLLPLQRAEEELGLGLVLHLRPTRDGQELRRQGREL